LNAKPEDRREGSPGRFQHLITPQGSVVSWCLRGERSGVDAHGSPRGGVELSPLWTAHSPQRRELSGMSAPTPRRCCTAGACRHGCVVPLFGGRGDSPFADRTGEGILGSRPDPGFARSGSGEAHGWGGGDSARRYPDIHPAGGDICARGCDLREGSRAHATPRRGRQRKCGSR
jgi:hypothetical protein